jgi:hypothetical protein
LVFFVSLLRLRDGGLRGLDFSCKAACALSTASSCWAISCGVFGWMAASSAACALTRES